MNTAEALQIIKEAKTDYSQKNHIARGLLILAKYNDDMNNSIAFEHDQMWACDFEETVEKMTREEVVEMATLGWFENNESWSHF